MTCRGVHILMLGAMLAATGCVRRPEHVLSDKEMASLVADMEIAEGYLQTQPTGGNREELNRRITEGILEAHGVTRQEFDSTMAWYGRNVDDYYKLDRRTRHELEKRRRYYAGLKGDAGKEAEKMENLWPYSRMAMISEQSGSNVLRFSLPMADIKPGSALRWRMRFHNSADAFLLFGVEYADGSMTYLARRASSQRKQEMELQTDTAMKIKRTFGHLYVSKETALPLWIDSISLETLPFDSTQYYRMHSQRLLPP